MDTATAAPSPNDDPGKVADHFLGVNARPEIREKFLDIVANVTSMRKNWLSTLMDPRRDINDECGYPANVIDSDARSLFQVLYDREPVSNRVVNVLPKETWQVQPEVYEDDNPKVETQFEKDWRLLGQSVRQGSLHEEEMGSAVWEHLKRVDELSGIGQFGVLLIGLDDGLRLDQPANGEDYQDSTEILGEPFPVVNASVGPEILPKTTQKRRKLTFLRVFPESMVEITKYETNLGNPRFGMPVEYNVTFLDPSSGGSSSSGVTSGIDQLRTLAVHWSRVIHVADNLTSSEVFGVPRMRPVLNRLLDLRKLYGGSAEMYWRGAFPGISLESQPGMAGEADIDYGATRTEMEGYFNGLQRYLALVGMTAKSLAPQVVEPTAQIAVQIEAVCIQLGIPKRVFMGSERGELASSQDDAAWNDRLKERQKNYVTPRIIVPFVDRLIRLGVLTRPKGYSVFWPDLTSQSTQEKAQAAFQLTQALTQYAGSPGAPKILPPLDFFIRVLRFTEPEAVAILENARKPNDSSLIPPPPEPKAPAAGDPSAKSGNGSLPKAKPKPKPAPTSNGSHGDAA